MRTLSRSNLSKLGVELDHLNGSPGQDVDKPTEISVGDNNGIQLISRGSESLFFALRNTQVVADEQ